MKSCMACGQHYTQKAQSSITNLYFSGLTTHRKQLKLTRGEVLKGSYLQFPPRVWNIRHEVCITAQIKITAPEGRLQVKVFLQKSRQLQAPASSPTAGGSCLHLRAATL